MYTLFKTVKISISYVCLICFGKLIFYQFIENYTSRFTVLEKKTIFL